jgi:hypothetical protein
MADYYSLLSKAVANLPKPSPASARKAIYDRARKALLKQLRSLGTVLSEADIAREEAALESAVARLEAQYAATPSALTSPSQGFGSRPQQETPTRSIGAPPVAPSFAASPRASAPSTQTAATLAANPPAPSTVAPEPPPIRPAAESAPARSVAPESPPIRPVPPRPPLAPSAGAAVKSPDSGEAPARPTLGARPAPSAPRVAPPAPYRASAPPESSSAPPIFASGRAELEADDQAPPIDAATGVERAPYTPVGDNGSVRPSAPSRFEPPRASPLLWIVLAIVFGVVISIAIAAFLLRQKPQDLAIKEPQETTDKASQGAAKIAERVGGTATPAPTDTASPSATPTPETSASPTPTATPSQGATPPQTVATPSLPVAARAAMLIAVASDQQKPPAVSLGSVVWSAIPALPGQPATVGVKAESDIPDLKMHAIVTIRKNADPNLPASHTIDLRVTFADGAEIKGIKDMRVPMMRRDDPPAQDPLAGVRVKINDTYFLVGLNRAEADVARNVDLMASRGWFDFPLLLNDDRIAKLTFEKGADGERILNDALAAWKAP